MHRVIIHVDAHHEPLAPPPPELPPPDELEELEELDPEEPEEELLHVDSNA